MRYAIASVFALALIFSGATSANAESGSGKVKIENRLRVGSTGEEVRSLQQILASDPTLYPEGLVTGFYGPLTARAVSRFQAKLRLDQVGQVGPLTLAKINEILTAAGVSDQIPTDLLSVRVKIEIDLRDGKEEVKIRIKEDNSGKGSINSDDEDDEDDNDTDEDEDEDENELEIEVEVRNGRAYVEVDEDGDDRSFRFNMTSHDAIVAVVADRLNLTEEEVKKVIKFEDEDEDDDEDEDEDEDEVEDDD